MNFDVPSIVVMLLTSAIGFVYISYGKRMQETPYLVAGVALCVYGYFFDSLATEIVIGVLLVATPLLWQRFF